VTDDTEMRQPYWRLDESTTDSRGMWRFVRDAPAGLRPLASILGTSAPRPVVVVLTLQVTGGIAATFGLLATTGALDGLLTAGPTMRRVVAAVPGLLLVIGAFAIVGAMRAGISLAQAVIAPAVQRYAEQQLVAASLRVDLSAFDDPAFYDRMHRARERGIEHLDRATETLVTLLAAAFTVVAAATAVAVLHPVLLLVLLVGVLPEAWAVLRSARIGYTSMWRRITLLRRVNVVSDLAADRECAAEIRASQAEPFILDEFGSLAETLRRELVRVNIAQARTNAFGRAMSGVGLALTFGALALALDAGWVPLAAAGTAVIAIRSAAGGLGQLVAAGNRLFEDCLYIADYQSFLDDARTRTADGTRRPVPASPATIALLGVGFSYPDSTPALRDITLTLRRGEVVALVGENGSGKTTLAKLVAGLYRPSDGVIEWDGVDLRDLDPDEVAAHLGVVLQRPVRWPHDVRTNIRVGRHTRRDPDDTALFDVARQARVDEVVATLPDGWRTLLSQYFRGGRELSGGQWQRIAVARGLYRDAPILICDEPTAPLDARAEQEVFDTIREIGRGRTVLLITHRLASVRHADHVYLLHHGRLAEHGTHDELLAADGHYAELYRLQANQYGAESGLR
jgi:ATP-binding cassette subfamily B protein